MGRGDSRSRKGKIFSQAYGKTRPRRRNRTNKGVKTAVATAKPVKA